MYQFLTKNGEAVAFGLGVILTVIFLGIALSGIETFNTLSVEDQKATNLFDFGLYAVVAMAVFCALAIALFGIYHIATDFRSSLQGLIGVAIVAGIFLISWATSEAETTGAIADRAQKFGVSDASSRFISGAIKTLFAMLSIAGIAFVVSEVRNFFK